MREWIQTTKINNKIQDGTYKRNAQEMVDFLSALFIIQHRDSSLKVDIKTDKDLDAVEYHITRQVKGELIDITIKRID